MSDLLRKLEWSGVSYGPHMGAGNGSPHASCPICRGIRSTPGAIAEFIPEAIGHRGDCDLFLALMKDSQPDPENVNELSPAQEERLVILTEEANEVGKEVCKILRHGYFSYHPDDPQTINRELLQNEIIDLLGVLYEMVRKGDIGLPSQEWLSDPLIKQAWAKKLQYCYHQDAML